MQSRVAVVVWLLLSFALPVAGESAVTLGLRLTPELSLPMGDSAGYFTLGGGARVAGTLGLSSFELVTPLIDVGYLFLPVQAAGANLSVLQFGAGGILSVPFGKRFTADLQLAGGYFAGLLHGPVTTTGGSFYAIGKAGVSLFLSPRVSLAAAAGYGYYHEVYQGLQFTLGTTARLAGRGGGPVPHEGVLPLFPGKLPARGLVKISEAKLERIFPVLGKYYDTHPLGSVTLTNVGDRELESLEVRLEMPAADPAKRYIDAPKLSARIERLKKGESRTVDLFALFNENVLKSTEGTKAIAEVTVNYKVAGRDARDSETLTLEMYDRNALSWDDDRKVASFVTAKDDEVRGFSTAAAAVLGTAQRQALSANLQKGMVMLAALKELGVSYSVDPSSSYKDLSAKRGTAVDYVKFPKQTLGNKSGDCDDLSVAYCALLESVGVPTAFITVPGHIFTAFRLEIAANDARSAFRDTADLILRPDGSAWIPVETTVLKDGFLQAWTLAARQWREHSAAGKAAFFETAEAWKEYRPVEFLIPIAGLQVFVPAKEKVAAGFEEQMKLFVRREIDEREQQLIREATKTQGEPKILNALGVLYARYGILDKAAAQFNAALRRGEYAPALLNLGNLLYLQGSLEEALRSYQRALAVQPNNANVVLAVARTSHQLGNFGDAKKQFDRLGTLDPALAGQYGYLAQRDQEAGRAAEAARGGGVRWEE